MNFLHLTEKGYPIKENCNWITRIFSGQLSIITFSIESEIKQNNVFQ